MSEPDRGRLPLFAQSKEAAGMDIGVVAVQRRVVSRTSCGHNVMRETAEHFAVELAGADRTTDAAKISPKIEGSSIVCYGLNHAPRDPDIGELAAQTQPVSTDTELTQ